MKIEFEQRKPWSRIILIGAFICLLVYALIVSLHRPNMQVNLDDLTFAEVKQGDLDIHLDAFGHLVSKEQRLVTAPEDSTVVEILVRPGANVEPDTIILKLENTQTTLAYQEAKGTLLKAQSEYQSYLLKQKQDRLTQESKIEELNLELEKHEFEHSVNEQLFARGVSSKLSKLKSELAVKQTNKSLAFEKKKQQQLIEIQKLDLKRYEIDIEHQRQIVSGFETLLESMNVKANLSGTLQSLDAELGENIRRGTVIAKVGSDTELIVELLIPSSLSNRVFVGAPVTIKIGSDTTHGEITRLENTVSDEGYVFAEASITGLLPDAAKPELQISTSVFLETLTSAIYVAQVPGISPQRTQSIYLRASDTELVRKEVTFGERSGDVITIVEGLSQDDVIVQESEKNLGEDSLIKIKI